MVGGTGKTHIAVSLGTTLISNGKKARFFNVVDLNNALIKEQVDGNTGKLIRQQVLSVYSKQK